MDSGSRTIQDDEINQTTGKIVREAETDLISIVKIPGGQ
jgi:hypothetical protein